MEKVNSKQIEQKNGEEKIIEADFESRKIKGPQDLAKKEFKEFYQEIKQKLLTPVDFGNPESIKIPRGIEVASRKSWQEDFNGQRYAVFISSTKSGNYINARLIVNNVVEKVKMIKKVYNNKTPKPPEAYTNVIFAKKGKENGGVVKLDARAKSKDDCFSEAINLSNNRIITDFARGDFPLYRKHLNDHSPYEIRALTNPGRTNIKEFDVWLVKNACIKSDGTIVEANEDNEVKISDTLYLTLDTSSNATLPEMYLGNCDSAKELYETLSRINEVYKGRIEPFIALGVSILYPYIQEFWDIKPCFPITYLVGASKQGKSLLQGIINTIFGYKPKASASGNSTENAIGTSCSENNGIPQCINDYDYFQSQSNKFENYLVAMSEGGVRKKMESGTKYNNMYFSTSAIYSSNYMPIMKDKVFNRLLPLYFPENGINTKVIDSKFVNNRKLSRFLADVFKISSEQIFQLVDNAENKIIDAGIWSNKDRESNNTAIALAGIGILELISGYQIPNRDALFGEYCEWYKTFFKNMTTSVNKFLIAFPTLIQKKVLKENEHFLIEQADKKTILIFDTQTCLQVYNLYATSVDFTLRIDEKMFPYDLKASPYFVNRTTKYYKNKKSDKYANSTILDISDSMESENILYAIACLNMACDAKSAFIK